MFTEGTKQQEAVQVENFWGKPISVYTRAQALEDGVLIDVAEMAKEAGFTIPTAVSARVWSEVITPNERAESEGQSEDGRLWDVLWMLRFAIQMNGGTESELLYELLVSGKKVKLKAHVGGGDDGEPVITIMMPNED